MDLKTWVAQNYPNAPKTRGAQRWLVRLSGCAASVVKRAMDGVPIDSKRAAERLSAATGGAVSVASIMGFDTGRHSSRPRKSA